MKIMRNVFAAVVTVVLAGAGCYGTTDVSGTVTTPDMAYVSPDVQVVTDYDYPVFYSGGAYYRYDNGVWLRSHRHDRGYIRATGVPRGVLSIRTPGAYVHYHRGMANRVHRY
jgi:hypothetical protein